MKILAISGSLRAASSNSTLLRALPRVAPPGCEFTFREPLDALPYFNPDLEEAGLPAPVARWRGEIQDHSALVICSPEYAHGVPGVLKNALDWLVGGTEITGKPIAVIQTSLPSTVAHASLVEILTVMGGRVVPEASVGVVLRGRRLDESGIAADPALSPLLASAMDSLVKATIPAAGGAAEKGNAAMHAKGPFDVKVVPQADAGDGVGRMSLDKQFHGDLEAASRGQMLAVSGEIKGSAGYVAMERVTGVLGGRKGTFALQHGGTMNRGAPSLSVTVVPDSGTGELAGLAGRMDIRIEPDGKHFYDFEYTVGGTR
jgi:NAD(P)H-dependent FMN reductase